MLIRLEQMKLFEQAGQKNFEGTLCAFVRQRMPSITKGMSDEQLCEAIRSHASAAREFGLRFQSSIAQFVCLAFLPGPPFYKNKYLSAFLQQAGFDPNVKMKCIVDQITQELENRVGSSSK